ncbi:Tctex-1 [Cinara cedri]|uniref:Tctex-1 n=1 Tax=Cinara cedri TaxID=506608 RepID=A0A5E4MVP8_9HEMI|nr:Tctex-1 [Cinara cedri]
MVDADEGTMFVAEEVNDIIKESIENTIGNNCYDQSMENIWTEAVILNCLTKLCKLDKPFKYMVTCVIMQKSDAADTHTASACYWDNTTDGSCTVKWENQTVQAIVTVFGIFI